MKAKLLGFMRDKLEISTGTGISAAKDETEFAAAVIAEAGSLEQFLADFDKMRALVIEFAPKQIIDVTPAKTNGAHYENYKAERSLEALGRRPGRRW